MTPDAYDHMREAFHIVADGLMEWEDPPERTLDTFTRAYAGDVGRSKFVAMAEMDVEAIEKLSDAAIRSGDTQTAVKGYALALRLRSELKIWRENPSSAERLLRDASDD